MVRHMRIFNVAAAVALSSLVGCASPSEDEAAIEAPIRAVTSDLTAAKKQHALPLVDHGGKVLATSNSYAVYWGPSSAFPSDLESGMAAMLTGFERSSYLAIAQQYMRGAAISTHYAGTITDSSTPPSSAPNASALGNEVCKLVANPDPNGVYVVFTSNAPNVNYCAWHDKATCNGVTFQVAYVPNQALLSGCSPYTRSNLGCNTYSDGTVTSADSVAHELIESVTDPLITAWYDKQKAEIADKCNFDYQACVALPNGTSWQIQSEWSNTLGGCQQQ
jgi:hypothetical protein